MASEATLAEETGAEKLGPRAESGVQTLTKKRQHRALVLIAPSALFMAVFCGIPLVTIIVFSFWKALPYGMQAAFVFDNYVKFFTTPTYIGTIGETFIVAAILIPLEILICYPVAYFICFHLRNERLKLYLLLLCIVPFWTSVLIRMVAWLPLLGRKGLINLTLMSLGVVDEPVEILLYSKPSMILSMAIIWSVFMLGPLYFSMSKIDREVIEAARDLGASGWEAFRRIILPLTKPGLGAGVLFIFVMLVGEFSFQRFIGGGKSMMLANVLVQQQDLLQWPMASVAAVVMVAVTVPMIIILFRIVNLRKEL